MYFGGQVHFSSMSFWEILYIFVEFSSKKNINLAPEFMPPPNYLRNQY